MPKSLEQRVRDVARECGGELVLWINQDQNVGQVLNLELVGKDDPSGVSEATNGVCYAIVTELVRLIITSADQKKVLETFKKEMICIPDRYRTIQAKFVGKLKSFQLAKHLVSKNLELAKQWNRLISEGRTAVPQILAYWNEQLDRSSESVAMNVARVKALESQLYITDGMISAGVTWEIKQHNVDINSQGALQLVLGDPGLYMIGLQGTSGHAIGMFAQTGWTGLFNNFMFVDPNTGVFKFSSAEQFELFVLRYWSAFLNEYPTGVIGRYKK